MDHCPVCLSEAECDEWQESDALQTVSCPACGSLILTRGAVAFLNRHTADDPRRGEYSTVLRLIERSGDDPIDDVTLRMWSDWVQVSGPEEVAQLPRLRARRDS
jgi:hypothetical protein